MVDAGVNCLSRLDLEWDSSEQIVRAVYEAMAAARDDILAAKTERQSVGHLLKSGSLGLVRYFAAPKVRVLEAIPDGKLPPDAHRCRAGR